MPSSERNSNTNDQENYKPAFSSICLLFTYCAALQIMLSQMHDTNTCFFLDFDYLFERFQNFNETCKQLDLDHTTRRNLRYIMGQFRKMRAVMKNCVEESSTDNEK